MPLIRRNIEGLELSPLARLKLLRFEFELLTYTKGLTFEFHQKEDFRRLLIYLDIDSDHEEIHQGSKIVLILGSDNSEEILDALVEEFKDLGDVYYRYSSFQNQWCLVKDTSKISFRDLVEKWKQEDEEELNYLKSIGI